MPVHRLRSLACALVSALLVAGLSVLVGPTAPASAAPSMPTNLAANGDSIPTLTWDRVPGATKYVVQGSENSSFSPNVFSQDTVNNTYVPVRVLKAGTLHWRVQAVDSSGASAWAQAQTTIGEHLPPTGLTISPSDQVLPPVSPPVISWDAVAGATGYDLEVDAEGDGVGGTLKSNVKTTTYVWPDPQGVGERQGTENFFVRVRARFDNGLQSDWSEYVSYDVTQLPAVMSASCGAGLICAPDPDTGVRPSVSVQDVVFDWDPVKGAKQYEIWVALNQSFTNQVEKRTVYGTRYSPATTYDNNNYFWKVRAINAADQPTPWPDTPNEFQRRWPHQPQLVYPPVASAPPVSGDFYFQWTPVRHASLYQLDMGPDSSFTPGTYKTCTTASTTYTAGYRAADNCMPGQGSLTYWRVRAIDGPRGVEGIYSDTGRFVYDSGAVEQQSPVDMPPMGAPTVDIPTLRWAPSQDAEQYEVVVTNASGGEVARVTTSALSWTPWDALTPADGPFTWTVVAIDGDGHKSPRYPGSSFDVSGTGLDGGSLTPLPGAVEPVTSRFPQLSWEPMTGAAYYKLRVSDTPGFVLPESATDVLSRKLKYPSVTDHGTYFLRPGTYTWWVDAYSATNVKLATGPAATFTVTDPEVVSGQALALDGLALDAGTTCTNALAEAGARCDDVPATPVLDWSPVPGAGGYLVYLAEDPDFTNRVLEPYAATINSRWTPTAADLTALEDNQSGEAYYWFVRPCASVTPLVNCGPDPVSRTDAATNAFRKVSPRVTQFLPAPGAVEKASEVTFTWEDYRATNSGAFFDGGASSSPQSAMQYRIQVSQSATITDSNVIDDATVDQPTYTAVLKTYPEGDLFWRVQAIDAKGNRLAWSETRKFVKATPAANLDPNTAVADEQPTVDPGASPAFNSHVSSGEFPFRWTAQDFDVTWKFEVYKNDDTTLSTANRVLSTTSKQAAFVPPTSLPPSSQPYRWRIVRYDVTNAESRGRWSDLGRFWVDPQPVNLTSPANGAGNQHPSAPVLRWEPYATGSGQAMRYSVDIRNSAGGSVGSVASTYATAWAPAVTYPGGTYSWSVTAYDASGNAMGTSPTWTFTVVDTPSATTAVSIAGSGQVGSQLTLTPPVWDMPDVTTTYQWYRGTSAISGATATSYTVATADVDKALTVKATGIRPGYKPGTSTSNAIFGSQGPSISPSQAPSITGVAAARNTLTANPGTWPGSPTYAYQWFVDGAAVARETNKTYVVRTRDAGLPVSVRVTATTAGYAPGTAFSPAVSVAKLPTTTTATLADATISRRARAKLTVTVTVVDLGVPLGSVQVKDGSKVIAKVGVRSDSRGVLTIRLKKLLPGKHKLKVSYLGSTATSPSTAKRLVLKVSR